MVSIKDIAKKAGVSISTVSYALNGSPKVTAETSEKILAIAKELNYIPNAAARSLKNRKTKIIGAYLSDYGGPFFGELLRGIRKTLNQNGYDLVACTGKESYRFLPEGIIDGAIVLDPEFTDEELLSYAERKRKIVVLDRELTHPNIGRVLLDNQMGTHLALEHIIKHKHKKIILVTGSPNVFDSNQRLLAAKQLLKQHPELEFEIFRGRFDQNSGREAAKYITKKFKEPVAVFCFNDQMAIGLYSYIEEKNQYKIGEDIHVVGFDNIEVSAYLRPRLTTIHYSKVDWGSLAAEQLLRLIKNKKTSPQMVPVELLEGESVL